MYDENRKFSFTNFFIKMIIVIIFVLFAVWLISLSNKGISNSLDVLTDDIFSQNIEKMKEVGKSYFTTERLPQKVGEIKTLTLAKMYDEKYILELKDKDGHACSAANSYVSIEKFDNEYQMKVYLECGEESNYVIVIMGCYDYCDTDICEKKEESSTKEIEYEYMLTKDGKWSDYGNWSEWSKVSVNKTDYREVETKVVSEDYAYDKTITETVSTGTATCPSVSGYTLISMVDGVCNYKKTTTSTVDPTCPSVSGYTNTGRSGFTCNYSKTTTSTITKTAECPDGYNESGNSCVKTTTSTTTKTATCPDGYDESGSTCAKTTTSTTTKTATCPDGYDKSGNSCVKETTATKSPVCPSVSGYTYTSRSGFTCNYKKTTTTYSWEWYKEADGSSVPYSTDPNTSNNYYAVINSADYIYSCDEECAFEWYYTYTVYKKVAKTTTSTTTKTATCPDGYDKSGSTCAKVTTSTANPTCPSVSGYTNTGRSGFTCNYKKTTTSTANPTCPSVSGYTYTSRSGFTCNYKKTTTSTANPTCPIVSGYTNTGRSGFTCNYKKTTTSTTTKTATCPNGYNVSGNSCIKITTNTTTKNAVCSTNGKMIDGQCYKEVESVVKITGTRDVTYYRYRVREYIGGSVDYKWSKSNNDTELLNADYKLTGRTR